MKNNQTESVVDMNGNIQNGRITKLAQKVAAKRILENQLTSGLKVVKGIKPIMIDDDGRKVITVLSDGSKRVERVTHVPLTIADKDRIQSQIDSLTRKIEYAESRAANKITEAIYQKNKNAGW